MSFSITVWVAQAGPQTFLDGVMDGVWWINDDAGGVLDGFWRSIIVPDAPLTVSRVVLDLLLFQMKL